MTDWLFIDGSSLIFRAFYGVPVSVRGPKGAPINAIRGFLETLTRLVSSRRPHRLAVATDEDWRPRWRVDLLPEYKSQRTAEPIPPLLIPQMPVITELLRAIGVDIDGLADFEAEDVIASWTSRVSGSVEIASGDRDLFALVEGRRVVVLYPEKAGLTLVDEDEVSRRYGIPGQRYADFAILRGDPSDGLPGLKGVGAVAAAGIVKRYGGVAGLLDKGTVTADQRTYLERALQLVPPVATLPIELPAGRRHSYPVDAAKVDNIAEAYGVTTPAGRLIEALQRQMNGG